MRLDVLLSGDGWLVLNKPAWLGSTPDPWQPGEISLQDALQKEVGREKPELLRFGLQGAVVLPPLEAGCNGPVVVAGTRELASSLKGDWGSDMWALRFILLAEDTTKDGLPLRECDLPIARHHTERKAVISHRTGKKARTVFRLLGAAGRLGLWEACTSFIRPHQIRLHAAEMGLLVAGEDLYSTCSPIGKADLGGGRPATGDRILHPGPAVFLQTLRFQIRSAKGVSASIRVDAPKSISRWLRSHSIDIPESEIPG